MGIGLVFMIYQNYNNIIKESLVSVSDFKIMQSDTYYQVVKPIFVFKETAL